MKSNSGNRIYVLSFAALLLTIIVIVRLFIIQIINGEDYSKRADRQYAKPTSDLLSRGTIYFQEKDGNLVSAATLKTEYIISINPSILADPEAAYDRLNAITPIDKDDFMGRALQKSDPYEVITRFDDKALADKVSALAIPGLSVYKDNVRFYPGGRLAAQTLGIVAQSKDDGTKYAGRYGLEKYYEPILSRPNDSLNVNFFAEMFSNIQKSVQDNNQAVPAGNIVLSIEPNVELYVDKEMSTLETKWNPDSLGAVVVEPKTGRIIADTFLPDFDPNDFGKEKDVSVFSDPLVENVFEFGSIVKPLTISAAIDAGVLRPDTKYDDKGYVMLSGKKIENHDHLAMGVVDMQAVIDNSLNTGAVFAMQKLGRDRFRNYMDAFGLGKKTGIDLPNETPGLTANLKSKYEVDYGTASFGQGIALTPIEAVSALSVLANGGVSIKPRLVDKIESDIGVSKNIDSEDGNRVLQAKTTEQITGMLVHAFDYGLQGGAFKIKQYSIAAKTGTAQIPDGKGGYSDNTLHSFFGYFPAYNARFLVLIYMVNPKNGATFSSNTLPTPFVNIAKFLLNYYEVPPDR